MARSHVALLVTLALVTALSPAWVTTAAGAQADADADGTEAALTGITQIDAGIDVTCARLSNGQARCWGDNLLRQLGDGTQSNSARPVAVENGLN